MAVLFAVVFLGLMVGGFLHFTAISLSVEGSRRGRGCPICRRRFVPAVIATWQYSPKCKCGSKLLGRRLWVELLTGFIFGWAYLALGLGGAWIKALLLGAFLIVISVVDIDRRLIQDKVLVVFAITGLLVNSLLFQFAVPEIAPPAAGMAIAVAGGGGLMLAVAMASRGGMGGGDVKFAAVLGIWLGWQLTLLALLTSFVLGAAGAAVALILRRKGRKDFIPFGPYIAAAAFGALLYGDTVIAWYLRQLLR